MKRVHPNLDFAAALIVLVCLANAGGCKNQQTPLVANPFLAPNRVPPPSTRALLPGQAQPYYQGDPLPVTQKAPGPQSNAVVQASAEAEMPTADGNLAWTAPSVAPTSAGAAPAPQPVQPVNPQPNASTVAGNETSVAIPDDGNSLRFALPTREPELTEPQSFTPSNPTALAAAPAPVSNQQAPQLPSPPSSRDILQAAYTEPVITSSQAPTPSPWQTPQVGASIAQAANAAPATTHVPQQYAVQPTGQPLAMNTPPSLPPNYAVPSVAPANTMEVRLREVPSPPPRIRIPGTDSSVLTVGSADGFRPRTSMR